ncbi:AfsR/SARP family transcriptional regulator [Arthrobacter sp. PsM3]|uniref:AfsR/SARP family transcriptional regulator n=1 Tax=Arthrobacter sp. PsM3 TaxID=3030531 RepID=UPI00263A8EC3|nr:BTAD domain-containing putative transcriptional regulator [Arthrobacter sp. PsM3]MDN4645891.1 BTAD domain-containing putative transcriptional regulator [Arthrobacter sp. PsM3]
MHVAARQQRLIAALALRGPRLRSYLVGMLWPEYPDARALESLRVSVHIVSRQLPGLLVNDGPMLSLSDDVDVDLYRVRAELRELAAGARQNGISPLLNLRDAELLPGWYEDWVIFEQNRLLQDRLRAFTNLSETSLSSGDYAIAAEAAEAALEIEPLYESAVRLLIRADLNLGNIAAALRTFEKYQGKLQHDLGLLPSGHVEKLIANARGHQI